MKCTYLLGRLEEPGFSRLCVGNGLLSGEGLGGNDKDGSLWVTELQNLCKIGSVNVGDKVSLQVSFAVMFQGLANHDRSKIRSTDTNVDDSVDRLSSVTFPSSGSDLFRKLFNVVEDLVDVISSSFLVNLPSTLGRRWVSESNVENSSVFRSVDVLSRKHGISESLDLSLSSEIEE